MSILQKLFAALLMGALIGSLPVTAFASVAGVSHCDAVASSGSDDGCCGCAPGVVGNSCSMPCATSSAAAVGAVSNQLPGAGGGSPIAWSHGPIRLISGPPDTAPPKTFLR